MNFKQIVSVLEENRVSKHDFANEVNDSFPIIGNAPIVAKKGGKPGEGDQFFIVRHLVDHDIYIRLDGFYDSYSGVDFTNEVLIEVEPKTVQQTIYVERVVFNFAQLKAKMNSLGINPREFVKPLSASPTTKIFAEQIGGIDEIERVGDQPGDGDMFYVVKYFPRHDVYIRVDAKNDSFTGTDFTNSTFYEVKPVERKVVFYE